MTSSPHTPLVASPRQVLELHQEIGRSLADALNLGPTQQILLRKLPTLIGPGFREDYALTDVRNELLATDDRGLEQPVLHIGSNKVQHVLIGMNLSWLRRRQRLHFGRSQLLAFLAWGHSHVAGTIPVNRRQLLRLEWEGVDERGKFEAPQAAHPHWQIDQWLAGYDAERSRAIERLLRSDSVREFEPPMTQTEIPSVRWIRAVHLPAAAEWATSTWMDEDATPHARPPNDLAELKSWSISSARYLSNQLRDALDGIG